MAEEPVELAEAVGPEALIGSQPFVGAGQRARLEPADMGSAADFAADETGAFEHLDMLGGACERDRERLGKLADRALAEREGVKHSPTRVVAQRVEDHIQT